MTVASHSVETITVSHTSWYNHVSARDQRAGQWMNWNFILTLYVRYCRSQWPRGLRRRSAAAWLLRLWVRFLNTHRLAPAVPFSVVAVTKTPGGAVDPSAPGSLSDAEKASSVPAGLHRLPTQVEVEVVSGNQQDETCREVPRGPVSQHNPVYREKERWKITGYK